MACCIVGIVVIEVVHGYSTTIFMLFGTLIFLSILFYCLQLVKRLSEEAQKTRDTIRESSAAISRATETLKIELNESEKRQAQQDAAANP
jgi:hypothetical protein